jgi:hypothetical protein
LSKVWFSWTITTRYFTFDCGQAPEQGTLLTAPSLASLGVPPSAGGWPPFPLLLLHASGRAIRARTGTRKEVRFASILSS